MMWTCTACEFAANEDGQEACVACGSERPEEEEQQQETDAESAQATEENDDSVPEVVVIELPAKEKLGVKLMPPKDGVIDHGLAIDNINNPLLENKVQAGDLIVAIGGQNVDGMGFSDAIDLIRKMPRPLAISFEIDEVRRQEVVREKYQQNKDDDLDKELTTYAVVFDNGPMGLNLEEAVRYGIDGAVVRALKGQAKTSGMITVGDIVYKVNETDVLCMPYLEVMNVLRNATAPKTLQFVPKDKLADVQRVNSRHSESFRLRESTSHVKQKLMNNPRLVKDDGNDGDDNQSIAQLILDNQAATIKKGRMYKQGRVMRNWKSRYFVLSVSKVEYFKSPSSTTSRGEMSFLNHRCTVRSLPGTGDVVCRSPNVTAEYLLEIRVDDRRMVMACTSESDKKGWMDAVKLAIDASKTVNRTQSPGESLREAKALRTQRTESLSMDGTFLERNAGGRLSQFNYEAFSTPVVHVGVLSATNLTKSGSSVNALCEVTVGAETFKTSVVKNQRSPVWKQDNSASFEAPSDEMVVEIRIFDEHLFRATELIATLSIPLKSLPNMQKTTKKYPLALGSRSAGAVLTLSLEYVNKQKAYEEDQERGRLGDDLNSNGMMNQRDEMVKIKAEAQMAADEATHHAARAQEEAHMLLEQSRQKAEAAMAAAREEQREGKAAVEKAMAEAARAKEEAEKQLAEAKRAQEEAQKLIEANRRIQESDVQGPSIYAVYRKMIQDGQSNEDVKKKMQENSIDEMDIEAFFDGINSYDEKIRALHAEVEKLKRTRSVRQKEEARAQDMLANLGNSSKLLDGRSLLHLAAEEGRVDLLRIIIEQDVWLYDLQGRRAADIARENNRDDIASMIEARMPKQSTLPSFDRGARQNAALLIGEREVRRNRESFVCGSFSEVYKGTWLSADVVIKRVKAFSEADKKAFWREARIWKKAKHPNIVPFFGAYFRGPKYLLVCKEATNGNLRDYLKREREQSEKTQSVWQKLYEAALGLLFLHLRNIIHSDLKCNQILVGENGEAMLTDFGMSFISDESRPSGGVKGAVRWKEPECLRAENPSQATKEADVYSFGMCVVEAVTGRFPWGNLPDFAVMHHVQKEKFLLQPPEFSDAQWNFVKSLCAFDPHRRLTMDGAVEELKEFARQERRNGGHEQMHHFEPRPESELEDSDDSDWE
ncbi:hypothetical protein PC118_g780 [Phytophthora cactorum]|uniref:Uncharacterized protein n=5 Tax=Phytophthora cactorum TaxID=29920 RepID=A0A8T1A595_9STRA|nr:hypothetical protein PC112_g1273 [Phytophthora cactorum]KAG2869600.1 hypothetical protein PC113_g90 [Phytophthora cactorum]KAG2935773.1 hypothetical protein PC114_g364 [Phytophthora cactorum]KAG2943254.1 hypothetical protein PC115_g954 [Phytophthora cactorum]KAG2999490.1 hypothetical protein PC118_g780 [Phytophthora cactorum]